MQARSVSLEGIQVAFCDSREALERARAQGLPGDAAIRTSSPALAMGADPHVLPLENDAGKLRAYWGAALPLTRSVFDAAVSAGASHGVALVTARASLDCHRLLTKALFLAPEDFVERRAVLLVETGQAAADRQFNAPVAEFLSGNSALVVARFSVPRDRPLELANPPLAYRLRLFDPAAVGVRAFAAAWRYLQGRGRRRCLMAKHSELGIETAFHLGLRGFVLRQLEMPKLDRRVPAGDAGKFDDAVLLPVVRAFIHAWFATAFHPTGIEILRKRIVRAVAEFETARTDWSAVLRREASVGPCSLITNFPGDPTMVALAEAARAEGIPVVACQHGVTREICADHGMLSANYENGVADLFLCFNNEAKAASDRSTFRRGSSAVVGLPRQFFRLGGPGGKRVPCPLAYIVTALPAGNVNFRNGGVSDIERARRERALVDTVLGRLPHRVRYKTYPARDRYPDGDPLADVVRAYPNLDLFDRSIDLRYLFREHRVLVSARATSTISWCVMSGLPFVFLDVPDHAPLNAQAKEDFRRAFFVFDWIGAESPSGLFDLLSLPIEEIEAMWRDKSAVRQNVISRWFSPIGVGAGRRGADLVSSHFLPGRSA